MYTQTTGTYNMRIQIGTNTDVKNRNICIFHRIIILTIMGRKKQVTIIPRWNRHRIVCGCTAKF